MISISYRRHRDEGEVLDILVQAKRDKRAALKLIRKLLKRRGLAPENWITDKLSSYGAAPAPARGRPTPRVR